MHMGKINVLVYTALYGIHLSKINELDHISKDK